MHALKHAALLCCCMVAFAAAPCARASDPGSPDATFRAGTAEWMAAYNAGDADRIVALYAADAVVMPPDAPAAEGHAAIRDHITKDMAGAKAAGVTLKDMSSETGSSGDLGWHAGRFAVTDGDGKTVVTGKYAEIWQRQNGQWRIIRDIWNNDASVAPPAPAAPPAPPPPPPPPVD